MLDHRNSWKRRGITGTVSSLSPIDPDTAERTITAAWIFPPVVVAISFNAEPTTYAVTGAAAWRDLELNNVPSSYSTTGAAATTALGKYVNAESSTYSITGADSFGVATKAIVGSPVGYAVTGAVAGLSLERNNAPSSYATTGANATIATGKTMNLEPGALTYTGRAATTLYSKYMLASPTTFSVSGSPATTLRTAQLTHYVLSYATWNPADKDAAYTLSNGNRTATRNNTANTSLRATMPKSTGKWYYEVTWNIFAGGDGLVAMATPTAAVLNTYPGSVVNSFLIIDTGTGYAPTPFTYASTMSPGVTAGSNKVIGVAVDLDARKLWIRHGGAWRSGDPVAGTGANITWSSNLELCITGRIYWASSNVVLNTGASAFIDPVPSGFNAGWYEGGSDTYVYSGADLDTDTGRVITLDTSSYSVVGANAELVPPAFAPTLVADADTFPITGAPATTARSRSFTADSSSYSHTGAGSFAYVGRAIQADSGAYSTTGTVARLSVDMRAVPTTYSVTGVANGFGRGRVMDANGGVYSVTGSPTTQIRVSFVNAQPGALTYTGFLATFAKGTAMTADPSTYTHTGAASTSLRSRVEPLFASAYGLTGFESFGSVSYTASLDPGSYTTTGYESTYEIGVFGTMRMWNGGWVVAKPRVYNGSMQPALVKYWDNTEWREVTTL